MRPSYRCNAELNMEDLHCDIGASQRESNHNRKTWLYRFRSEGIVLRGCRIIIKCLILKKVGKYQPFYLN